MGWKELKRRIQDAARKGVMVMNPTHQGYLRGRHLAINERILELSNEVMNNDIITNITREREHRVYWNIRAIETLLKSKVDDMEDMKVIHTNVLQAYEEMRPWIKEIDAENIKNIQVIVHEIALDNDLTSEEKDFIKNRIFHIITRHSYRSYSMHLQRSQPESFIQEHKDLLLEELYDTKVVRETVPEGDYKTEETTSCDSSMDVADETTSCSSETEGEEEATLPVEQGGLFSQTQSSRLENNIQLHNPA